MVDDRTEFFEGESLLSLPADMSLVTHKPVQTILEGQQLQSGTTITTPKGLPSAQNLSRAEKCNQLSDWSGTD